MQDVPFRRCGGYPICNPWIPHAVCLVFFLGVSFSGCEFFGAVGLVSPARGISACRGGHR